jgi:hypothetical protein
MTNHLSSELPEFAACVRGFIRNFSARSQEALPDQERFGNPLVRPPGTFSPTGGEGRDEGEFNRLALDLFTLQFDGNAPYRRFCQARQADPQTVQKWTDIPAVPAAAFKEWELTCLPPERRTAVFHSSGTTEQRPSRHFHCADSLALYECSALAWFAAHFNKTDCILLTPAPADAPHSSLVHMFATIRREFASPQSHFTGELLCDGGWELDLQKTEFLLRQAVASNRPVNVLGTAFSFVHLLDYLAAFKLSLALPHGSRVLETGGYKGRSRALPRDELHALITKHLGVPPARIVCEYGMSELSSQAYDSAPGKAPEAGRFFRFPPWARVQVVSPETGREAGEAETGLLRIFDLANVYSVMAIQTEDLGVRRGGGFELLGRAALAEPRGCSLASI